MDIRLHTESGIQICKHLASQRQKGLSQIKKALSQSQQFYI